MEVSLFTKNKETYTRFKILRSQHGSFKNILNKFGLTEPSKKSSLYVYYEVKGDVINRKKEE